MSDYVLPDGSATDNESTYLKEWRSLGYLWCDVFGWELYGFDPGLAFYSPTGHRTREIDTDVAIWVKELVDAAQNVLALAGKTRLIKKMPGPHGVEWAKVLDSLRAATGPRGKAKETT